MKILSLLIALVTCVILSTQLSAQRFDWVSFTPSAGGLGAECMVQDDNGFIYTIERFESNMTVGSEVIAGGGFGFSSMMLIKWNQLGEPVQHAVLVFQSYAFLRDMAYDDVNQQLLVSVDAGGPMSVNGAGSFSLGVEPVVRFNMDLEYVSSLSQTYTYNTPMVCRDGFAYVSNGYNSVIRRYDAANVATWSTANSTGDFNISSIALNPDSLIYAIGFSMGQNQTPVTFGDSVITFPAGGNSSDLGIVILDTLGNVVDANYFGRTQSYGNPARIATDAEGFVYVACPNTTEQQQIGPFTIGPSTGANDVFVAKLTRDLEVVWVTELHHTGGNMESRVLAIHPDGKVLVSGLYGGTATMGDFTLPSNPYGLGYIAQLDGETGEVLYATHLGTFEGTSRPFDATIIGDKYFITGLLFSSSTGQAAFGCYDDCQSFNFFTCFNDVPFELPTISVSFDGDVLTANTNIPDAQFTWTRNGFVLEGETGATITPTSNGEYTVSVEVFGCFTSASIELTTIGVGEFRSSDFVLFPNPANGLFSIRSVSGNLAPADVTVSNAMGQVVYRHSAQGMNQPIDLRGVVPGIYWVRLNGLESRMMVITE
jgi:hypothetical protein